MESHTDPRERWNEAANFVVQLLEDEELRVRFRDADRFEKINILEEFGIDAEQIVEFDQDLDKLSMFFGRRQWV